MPNIKASGVLAEIISKSPIKVIIQGVLSKKLSEKWSEFGYPEDLIEGFLKKRESRTASCAEIAKDVIGQISDVFPEGEEPVVQISRWDAGVSNGNEIIGKAGFDVSNGEDYLKDHETRIYARCKIPGLAEKLNSSNPDQSASGEITLEFSPNGEIVLVINGTIKDEGWSFSGAIDSKKISLGQNSALEILQTIKKWQLQDWSSILKDKRVASTETLRDAIRRENEKIVESRRRSIHNQLLVALKCTTSLTPVDQTIDKYKALKIAISASNEFLQG